MLVSGEGKGDPRWPRLRLHEGANRRFAICRRGQRCLRIQELQNEREERIDRYGVGNISTTVDYM